MLSIKCTLYECICLLLGCYAGFYNSWIMSHLFIGWELHVQYVLQVSVHYSCPFVNYFKCMSRSFSVVLSHSLYYKMTGICLYRRLYKHCLGFRYLRTGLVRNECSIPQADQAYLLEMLRFQSSTIQYRPWPSQTRRV